MVPQEGDSDGDRDGAEEGGLRRAIRTVAILTGNSDGTTVKEIPMVFRTETQMPQKEIPTATTVTVPRKRD
jgi:hypothetical protein